MAAMSQICAGTVGLRVCRHLHMVVFVACAHVVQLCVVCAYVVWFAKCVDAFKVGGGISVDSRRW